MGSKSGQKPTPKQEPQSNGVSDAPSFNGVLAEMAWQVAVPFMVLTLFGSWLDGRYDTKPLFTIIGLFLGLAGVTVLVYRLVQKHYPGTFSKKDDK